jgi:hypothetical protein
MPCQGGPTREEIEFERKMKDPEFAKLQKAIWKQGEKVSNFLHERQLKAERKEIENEMKHHRLENLFFSSAMTVILCKTMEIVVTNFGFKYLPVDYEWWWNEHKHRDKHGHSVMDKEELAKKLIALNQKYKVV